MSPPKLKIGWIGLGNMGLAMAKNLQTHLKGTQQPSLHYTNRTLSRGEPLQAIGAIPHETVTDLLLHVDIIFCSLSDDKALEAVAAAIIASGALNGKIIVDTSTVHPDTTISVAAKVVEAGGEFIAAPVFGATPVAERGQLLMAIAGSEKAIEVISPLLVGVIARAVIPVGTEVGKAGLMKTIGNFITAGLAELISEAHVFAEKSSLGSDLLEQLIDYNYGAYALSVSKKLTTGAYLPPKGHKAASDLKLAIKDVGHGVKTAENAGVNLNIGKLALGHLKEAEEWSEREGEGRSLDSSSVFGTIRRANGLSFETDFVKKRDGEV